jgi:hypothetical protein
VNEQSSHFADRVRESQPNDPDRQVHDAFLLALGRSPDPTEQAAALSLIQRDGLDTLCRGLLNTNAFLYY